MSKKHARITNPELFLPLGSEAFSTGKKHPKPPKHHQLQEQLVPSAVSSKILKEALLQQKEIQREEDNDANVADSNPNNNFVFPKVHRLKDEDGDGDGDEDNCLEAYMFGKGNPR